MEMGRCLAYPCGADEPGPEILVPGQEYDASYGYYHIMTTSAAHNSLDGFLK